MALGLMLTLAAAGCSKGDAKPEITLKIIRDAQVETLTLNKHDMFVYPEP